MKETSAFSPCHITGLFQIFNQSTDALHVGSRGAGVSLTHGVTTIVRARHAEKSSLQISVKGTHSDSAEVSRHVANALISHFEEAKNLEVTVKHYLDLPVGAGFGTSGAAALSLSLAMNDALDLGMSKIEASQFAHVAEVECKTGLGTVIAEAFGGMEIRVKPGAPGIGQIRRIPVRKDYSVVCMAFGSLSTRTLLNDKGIRGRVNKFGGELVDRLLEKPSVADFMEMSRQFAEQVGLIPPRVSKIIEATDEASFICSMPMFGKAVFTLVEHDSLEELLRLLGKHNSGGRLIISSVDRMGARLLA